MNSFANSSADRSMRLIYDRHGIGFNDEIKIHDISEMLYMVDGFCHSMASHCIRVSNYSTAIGKGLNLTGREINLLWCASLLHDIGKLKIPREILNKPSKLTGEEYEIVKAHSRKGYELIRKMGQGQELSDIILYHHERFDGKGYPTSLKGKDIPIMSRIVAVADSYDAMTTERPYSTALSHEEALMELERGKKTQFDGDIVDSFVELLENRDMRHIELNSAFGL